jgi:transcriptional regulator
MEGKKNIRNFLIEEIASLANYSLLDSVVVSGGNPRVLELFLDNPFSIDGVAISVCVKGRGKAKIGFKEYEIEPLTLMVLIPELIIEPLERSDDLFLKTIFFSQDFIANLKWSNQNELIEKIMSLPCIALSEREYDTLLKYYSFIEEQYSRDTMEYKSTIIKSLLFALVVEIFFVYSVHKAEFKPPCRTDELINRFMKLLQANYKSEHNVRFYAGELCVTPNYLMTLVKQKTGKSAASWINRALIIHSKRELKNTDKNIAVVSEELSFSSSSQFCRYFKKLVGITPRQFRNTDADTQQR